MNRTSTRPGRGDEERRPFTKAIARVAPGRDVFRRNLWGAQPVSGERPFVAQSAKTDRVGRRFDVRRTYRRDGFA